MGEHISIPSASDGQMNLRKESLRHAKKAAHLLNEPTESRTALATAHATIALVYATLGATR